MLRLKIATSLLRFLSSAALVMGMPVLKLLAAFSGDKAAFAQYMITTLTGAMGSVNMDAVRSNAASMGMAREALAFTDGYSAYREHLASLVPTPEDLAFVEKLRVFHGLTLWLIRAQTNPEDGVSCVWMDFSDGRSLQLSAKELGFAIIGRPREEGAEHAQANS